MRIESIFILVLVVVAIAAGGLPATSSADGIKLKIPKYEEAKSTDSKGRQLRVLRLAKDKEDNVEHIEVGLAQFVEELRMDDYKVDQIEMWIQGAVESGGLTKLVISVEGSGGMKVILRPKGN